MAAMAAVITDLSFRTSQYKVEANSPDIVSCDFLRISLFVLNLLLLETPRVVSGFGVSPD